MAYRDAKCDSDSDGVSQEELFRIAYMEKKKLQGRRLSCSSSDDDARSDMDSKLRKIKSMTMQEIDNWKPMSSKAELVVEQMLGMPWKEAKRLKEQEIFGSEVDAAYQETLKKLETVTIQRKAPLKKDPKLEKQRRELPIYKKKQEFLRLVSEHDIVIVAGETGSGKTTQIPQYLLEAGFAEKGRIGCTQLRRMAAISVAKRVSKEYGCKLGDEVGYTVRFDDNTCGETKIQYMTDGILLRECIFDKMLSSYSVIILDESHERTVDTDVLLAVLKHLTTNLRTDLKLIMSSATLDSDQFCRYFKGAPVFNIEGRMFPVEIIYSPPSYELLSSVYSVVCRINEREDIGDVLVFLTGEQEIENFCDILSGYHNSLAPTLEIRPAYAALPWEDQESIFEKAAPGTRKVIVATNIAETSLTVDGVRYVVDGGFVKQSVFDSRQGVNVLKVVRVSKAQAIQRAGRAGRTSPGKCYRMYTQSCFNHEAKFQPDPEIMRTSLTNSVLLLKRMGFNDILGFDFIDPPPKEAVLEALKNLRLFGAVDEAGVITSIGQKMAQFPLDPDLSKMLITSELLHCSEEILIIVSMMSVPSVFHRPPKRFADKQKMADQQKRNFHSSDGDLISLMNVYKAWVSNDRQNKWCKANFLQSRTLKQADDIRKQLHDLMESRSMKVTSCGGFMAPVLRSITTGLFLNKASLVGKHRYNTSTEPNAYIFPGSACFQMDPRHVVYHRIVKTKKAYMHDITPIKEEWYNEIIRQVKSDTVYRI